MGFGQSTAGSLMVEPWPGKHFYRINNRDVACDDSPADLDELAARRREIEPWITSLVASEHLSLLVGSGLTTALTGIISAPSVDMSCVEFGLEHAADVDDRAKSVAMAAGRGTPNIEDQVRAALELIGGLRVLRQPEAQLWEDSLAATLTSFAVKVLETESSLLTEAAGSGLDVAEESDGDGWRARALLASFLGSFVSRAATKERLHIFTTNYDRVIEFGLDEAGIWKIDRFVGTVSPRFRSSRLEVDLHYSPPGIRGEPRYLEGVVRLTKLHGSIDWIADGVDVGRVPVPFGCSTNLYRALIGDHSSLLVYPNPAKDVETSEYPYAELFRDFSAAVVRPESVLVTYGYGFGDDHINRVIQDMLTIPSTHLLAISFADPDLRLRRFLARAGRNNQVSILLGPHFGDLESVVHWYLPRPSVDRVTVREAALLHRRGLLPTQPVVSDEAGAEGDIVGAG